MLWTPLLIKVNIITSKQALKSITVYKYLALKKKVQFVFSLFKKKKLFQKSVQNKITAWNHGTEIYYITQIIEYFKNM